jgi:hypothetical protein
MDASEHSRQIRAFVHEFNNLFLAIGGHCELLVEQMPPAGQARADLMAIADANDRASVLAARLRAHAIDFARAAENADALSLAAADGTRE